MKAKEAASLLVVCMFALLTCTSIAGAGDLSEQLKARYQNKVLVLRHFYRGDHLSFQSDGSLVGIGEVGPWTTNGQIDIKSIELKGRNLEIKGRRVCLTYDDTTKSFNDVLEYLEQSSRVQGATHRKKHDRNTQKGQDWDKLKNDYENLNVAIEIGFKAETPSVHEVSDALAAVFMKP